MDELYENRDETAPSERLIMENAGSDVEEDLTEIDVDGITEDTSRQRYVAEYSADLDNLTPELQEQIITIDAHDDAALREFVSKEDMLHFKWESDGNSFTGEREAFIGESGPTFATDGMTPLDIFEKIWDETIINLIVKETNRYANYNIISNPSLRKESRINHWKDIKSSDLWTFYAILMIQSLILNPVECEYWSPRFPYLQIGNFKVVMSYRKFLLIKKFLHFVDNRSLRSNSKLDKISPIIDHLNEKFSTLYLPEQNIAMDESLLLWKERTGFVQQNANKSARIGIKSYELCESRSGYLWKFEIYQRRISKRKGNQKQFSVEQNVEKASNEPEVATSQIVYKLVHPLLNKGHTLTMDHSYNSPLLSRTLKAQKTDTLGTLRLNREFVPDSLRGKTKANMRPGEILYSQTEDLSVLVWRDSNLVALISTYHKVGEKYGGHKPKPKAVLDYNLSMWGVDKKDELLQAFPVDRIRNAVWYKKLFHRLFNMSIYNAYIIYKHTKKISHRDFRMMLADQILKKYCPQKLTRDQLSAGHFPIKGAGKARCKQCAKTKIESRTIWACSTCGVRLCVTCFKDYHVSE